MLLEHFISFAVI